MASWGHSEWTIEVLDIVSLCRWPHGLEQPKTRTGYIVYMHINNTTLVHVVRGWRVCVCVNSLAPGKFQWNFRYVIFKWILVVDGRGISCEIALILMSLDVINDQWTLVQVMAWCRQVPSHYLSQCWPRSLSPYGVTRPQGVNTLRPRQNCRHFADDTFRCIFLNEDVWLSLKISLKFVPKVRIINIPALVQIMAVLELKLLFVFKSYWSVHYVRLCALWFRWVNHNDGQGVHQMIVWVRYG